MSPRASLSAARTGECIYIIASIYMSLFPSAISQSSENSSGVTVIGFSQMTCFPLSSIFFALSIMQGIWARDIDALGRGGDELVKRGIDCTYPVFLCECLSALARTRIYGEEFKIGREL